jgi:hypothetical protein
LKLLLEMQKESGITPEALKKRPKVREADLIYMEVFGDLSPSRPGGDSIGNIPVSEFRHYCDLWGIDGPEEKERIFKYLKKLDDTFMKFVTKQRQAQLDKAKAKT